MHGNYVKTKVLYGVVRQVLKGKPRVSFDYKVPQISLNFKFDFQDFEHFLEPLALVVKSKKRRGFHSLLAAFQRRENQKVVICM